MAFLLLLAAAGLPYIVRGHKPPDRAPLVVVCDDNYPPYVFRDANGKLRGILPDHWALWERRTGVKVDLKAMDWADAQRFMQEGRADVIDTLFFTQERATLFDFTPPYARIEVPVFARSDLGGISDIPSLKGFTVGVKAGDAVINHLTQGGIDSLRQYPSYEAIVMAAKNQEIKVFSVDKPAAVYYLSKHGIASEFRQLFVLYTGEIHRAVPKNRPDLLSLVRNGFEEISQREYRAIERKWMGSPFLLKDTLRPWLPWILGGCAAILALAVGTVLLGHRVRAKTAQLSTALLKLQQSLAARQKSEEALRESHALFLLFMRHSPIYTFIKDVTATESRVIMASDNFRDMIGIPGSEMLGKTMSELFSPEFAAKISADDWNVVSKGEVLKLEEELGGRHYVTIKFPIVREGKTLLAGYTIDITERKHTEQALAVTLERYNLLAKQNRIITWAIDLRGLYTSLGDETFNVCGYRPEELVGKRYFFEMHPDEGRDKFKAKAFGYIEQGEPIQDLIHPAVTATGAIVWFTTSGIPTRDDKGEILGYWGISTDITDRRRAEEERAALQEQLTHSRKLESVGRLAGGVAHDFNNMLQTILCYTEMALEQVPPDRQLHDDLLEIQKAAQRSSKLTRQLQTFARKQSVATKPLNVNEAVESMFSMLRRLIGEDIGLEWKPGRDIGTVMMDPGQLDQVVINLCLNARDAVGTSGHIVLETSKVEIVPTEVCQLLDTPPGAYVLLSIRDNGPGMSPEVRERIFEPFFTTKPLGQGTGLGLSTVYGIVKQNGGGIRVESEPGLGAVFLIYLPCYAGELPSPESPAVAEATTPAVHETILLVEDEEIILRPTKRTLERLGYRVLSTASPKEAIRLFEKHMESVDLLITDVIMPEMNGPEMVRQMLKQRPALRYLFISGHTANLLAGQGLDESSQNCLQKPFSKELLAQKVREALMKH